MVFAQLAEELLDALRGIAGGQDVGDDRDGPGADLDHRSRALERNPADGHEGNAAPGASIEAGRREIGQRPPRALTDVGVADHVQGRREGRHVNSRLTMTGPRTSRRRFYTASARRPPDRGLARKRSMKDVLVRPARN